MATTGGIDGGTIGGGGGGGGGSGGGGISGGVLPDGLSPPRSSSIACVMPPASAVASIGTTTRRVFGAEAIDWNALP